MKIKIFTFVLFIEGVTSLTYMDNVYPGLGLLQKLFSKFYLGKLVMENFLAD